MRSDSGRRPGRDATYANILCAAAEQDPHCAPREPALPLTVIDLGVTVGSTAFFTDASEPQGLIDSGASSACISPENIHFDDLVTAVVDYSPNFGVKIGDAAVLTCVQIVDLSFRGDLALDSFQLLQGKKVRARGELDVHRALVVKGIDPNIILLSVKNLLDLDGVLVYFNKDNPHGVDNCLKLKNGLFSELRTDRRSYELTFAPRAAANAAAAQSLPNIPVPDAFFDRDTRDALRVHAALGHVGATIINISNVTVSGIRPVGLKEPHLFLFLFNSIRYNPQGERTSPRCHTSAPGAGTRRHDRAPRGEPERCAALQRPTSGGARRPSTSTSWCPPTDAPRCPPRSRTSSPSC